MLRNPIRLTIDRLFDAPALSGPTMNFLKVSPDGSRVTFLRAKDSDKDCLDLWEFDVQFGTARMLVDSARLSPPYRDGLSDEEQARRERQRTASLSGIVEYAFSPAGDALLFPLSGALFYCHLAQNEGCHSIVQIPLPGPVTDATVSPDGKYLAFVHEQNLFIHDLSEGLTRALTHDGGGALKYGMAEFVAQEEMDRRTGYWWAPDGRHIAFARVDESQVPERQRFEISGDNVKVVSQRYPSAGEANALVQIGVVNVLTGERHLMDLGDDRDDVYFARVNWLPDGQTLAIQRQSRDQKTLELLFSDIATGHCRTILKEASESWVDLHDELTFLKSAPEMIWASSRTGFRHLYLYHIDGNLIRQLTHGDWDVDNFRSRAIRGMNEDERSIFFVATAKTPTERHLFRLDLDSGECSQITTSSGVHSIAMSSSAQFYVDSFNSSLHPPSVGLFGINGNLRHWLAENRLDAHHPYAPYLETDARSEFGVLRAADGQTLHYRLFKPHDFDPGKKYPVILEVYGGPGVQRVLNTWAGSSFTQVLTRAGYLVLMVDNRGTAHRGVAFQEPILGELGSVEVEDQLAAIRWLKSLDFVDCGRLGIWGWSYGGYLTLMLMFKSPGTFRAGISGAPVTDWRMYDTHYTERYLGSPKTNSTGYESSSAVRAASGLADQLLLIHGMADDNVLMLHTTKLMRQLQDQRKDFDVMLYPGGKHGLLRQQDGRHAYDLMLKYFAERLLLAPAH